MTTIQSFKMFYFIKNDNYASNLVEVFLLFTPTTGHKKVYCLSRSQINLHISYFMYVKMPYM